MKLEGKIALVTGGGDGMGRAYCHRLAGDGPPVAAADIDGAAAERSSASSAGPRRRSRSTSRATSR